jgi:hypothetical protein
MLAVVFVSPAAADIQIVNCDAVIQSRKRGTGVNSLSDADFRALAPGVSWYYNWGATPLAKPPDVQMDYLPMAWNGASGFQTSLTSYLAAGNRPWRVLALNEPNLTSQADMTPSASAATFSQVRNICNPYNIPVISPHMAIGTPADQSVTAYDPLQGSNVTYSFQQPYLDAFLYYCGTTPPAGMATHSYGGYGEITWILNTMHSAYPTQTVWLTEFCQWGAATDADVLSTLIPAVDFCERTPWVEGYAWFMSRITGDLYNSLLSSSGTLTAAGQAYVRMPVHQTNIFYHVPGRLQAERYVALSQVDILPTTDTNGLADMKASAAGATLDYNIHVDSAGGYPLNLRVAGAIGQIRIYKGATLVGSATATQTAWTTVSTVVSLGAGTQTFRFVLSANAQRLNWIEFLSTDGTPSTPSGLTASPNGLQVELNWSAAAGATNYNIKRSLTNGGPYAIIASSTATSYTNTSLALGTTYYYVVSAVNTFGESGNSTQANATVSSPSVNLALNKPVTVSSVENSGLAGANAVDGNPATRWSSAFSDPQWLYVDLQATYDISRVKLNWEAAYGKAFQLQVSTDSSNWTTIYSTAAGTGGVMDLTGLAASGRYVRMYGTVRSSVYGYSLWELEVYGTVPVPTNQPPYLSQVLDQTVLAGRSLFITNTANDPEAPPQLLTYRMAAAPPGASIDTNTGVIAWRPAIDQSPSTQTLSVVVADNGSPSLSATQSFKVSVLRPALPLLSGDTNANGPFGFRVYGDAGPDYSIETSTNLSSWSALVTNYSPAMPFFWSDPRPVTNAACYYRARLGP